MIGGVLRRDGVWMNCVSTRTWVVWAMVRLAKVGERPSVGDYVAVGQRRAPSPWTSESSVWIRMGSTDVSSRGSGTGRAVGEFGQTARGHPYRLNWLSSWC